MRFYIINFFCILVFFLFFRCSNWEQNPTLTNPTSSDNKINIPNQSWSLSNLPQGLNRIYFYSTSFLIAGTDDGRFYYGNIFNLSSGGNTMERVPINCFAYTKIIITFQSLKQYAFAGTDKGLYLSYYFGISLDMIGKTWLKFSDLGSDSLSKVKGIYISGNKIYLFGEFINSNMLTGSIDSNKWTPSNFVPFSYKITAFNAFPSCSLYVAGVSNSAESGIYSDKNGTGYFHNFENRNIINSIAINSDNILYAGTEHGIYISKNYGKSWDKFALDTINVKFLSIDPKDFIYAATSNSILISDNNGTTFCDITPSNDLSINNMITSPYNNDNYLFLIQQNGITYYIKGLSPSTTPILAPFPYSPKNGSSNIESSVSLYWDEWEDFSPSYYDVQLSKNSDLSGAITNRTTSPSYYYENLESGCKYYWRVRSHISVYRSDWSKVFSFTTK